MKKFTILIITLFLCSCVGASKPSQFYQIRSIDSKTPAVSTKKLSIGIEDVQIPPYLDRPQIVTVRTESVELNVSEFNRWGELLSSSLPRVLADDISIYLPNSLVKIKRSISEPFNYTVMLEINRFDAVLGEYAELDVWWTIYKGNKIIYRQRSKFDAPTVNSYEDMVEQQSRLVGLLAKEIAEKFAKL